MKKTLPSEIVPAAPVEISLSSEIDPYPRSDQHPARVYLLRLRPGSRPAQQNALELFVRAQLRYPPPPLPRPRDQAYRAERAVWLEEFWRFPWHALRYQHVAAVQTALATMKDPPYSHTLINRSITATRRVLKEARRLGWMKPEDYETARDIEKVEGVRLQKGRHIEESELVEIFEKCSVGIGANQRALDTAAIRMLWGTGCRRGDVAGAQFGAYDGAKKTLVVIGKRNKQRRIELPEDVWKAIDAWIVVRGTHPGPLFHPVSQSDRVMTDRHIHPRTVGTILDKIVARCTGLKGTRFTSHDFRRTFISNEIDKGTNLSALAGMVGHDDVNTTVGYDLGKERAMRKIADGIKLPTKETITQLLADADMFAKIATDHDEKLLADVAVAANWNSYDFLKEVFTSSGSDLRQFDDGVSGERLSRLILDETVTIVVHRFQSADHDDKRLRLFRRGGGEEHAQLKLATFLWLVEHFKPTQQIIHEPNMVHGRPDLFMPDYGGVWIECGDTEARKVLHALITGYSCLLVPFVSCERLGGIMLRVKESELAMLRKKNDRDVWANHAAKGLAY